MPTQFFSTTEAAQELDISVEDARQLAQTLDLPRLGHAFIWDDDALDRGEEVLVEEDAEAAAAEAEEAAEEAQAAADEAADDEDEDEDDED